MSSFYRKSYDFHVSVQVACPCCRKLNSVKDVVRRTEYVYGEGYVRQDSCRECFDEKVKEVKAHIKSKDETYLGGL